MQMWQPEVRTSHELDLRGPTGSQLYPVRCTQSVFAISRVPTRRGEETVKRT